ncbi:MAG TPA: RNA polymerase factor sigma-32 [Bdellovibrionota bacterium]|jgi:RNA polymerase sigma-32 factor
MKKKGKNPPKDAKVVVPEVVKAKAVTTRGSTAVTPTDPLLRYLSELRKYPVLSPEEQQALAQKFRETGDMEIARRLVTTNLRLVVKIALEYKNAYHNVLDLIQEGNVGLMKAVSNYDPYKGTRLSYYASWWIRSYILKFLLDNFRLVKVGTTQAQKKLFYNLMREKDRLEAQGIHAGPKLLADQLNVKEKEVREMSLRLSSRGGEFSIDQPMGGDEDSRAPRDLLVDPGISVDESLAQKELTSILSDHISEFVHGLNEKERIVFQERLMNDDPKTLQEVADQFGITRERARQIESKVIEKLRKHMSVHMDGIELSPPRR